MSTKIDLTKPLILASDEGRKFPARVLCTDRKGAYPVLILYTDINNKELTFDLKEDFTYLYWRLENVPERKSTFQNVYEGNESASTVSSREKADGLAKACHSSGPTWKRVAVIETVYEDKKIVDVIVHKDV